IIQISPDLSCRLIVCRNLPSGKRWHFFRQEGVLDKTCSTQFLLNTRTFFQARTLLDQYLALLHTLNQLLSHTIELLFHLPDFVSFGDRDPLGVVTICELCRSVYQAVEASY